MVGIGKFIDLRHAFAEPTHAITGFLLYSGWMAVAFSSLVIDRTAMQQRSFRQDHHEQFQSEMERALQVLH